MDSKLLDLGNEVMTCDLPCRGVAKDAGKGIFSIGLISEEFGNETPFTVIGLNPGNIREKDVKFFLNVKPDSFEDLHQIVIEHMLEWPYYDQIKKFIAILGYLGKGYWTNLVKCPCADDVKFFSIPAQTKRVCVNKFLIRELEIATSETTFAIGKEAFMFCSLSFPDHYVLGIPHPSYADFKRLFDFTQKNTQIILNEIEDKSENGQMRAIWLLDLEPVKEYANIKRQQRKKKQKTIAP